MVERLAQLAHKREAVLELGPNLLVEDGVSVLPRLLGLVHGDIGVGHQRLDDLIAPVRHNDPDARRHHHFLVAQHDGSDDLGQQPVGDDDGLFLRGNASA